ncbi:PEP-CTERM sorting domain-containing protein [Acidobacteria bacterium AB60]|nr:PEP-CTERM sorting domain-containing protein [Acidobacteria bacterium AB60]
MRKRVILAGLLLIGVMGSFARADTVVFSTNSGSVNPTSQTTSWLFGNNMQLTFVGKLLSSVDTPSVASLGEFVITGFAGSDTFTNVPFNLTITQWLPQAGDNNATFNSILNGTISLGASSATVSFLEPSVTIGNVVYTLTQQAYTLRPDGLLSTGTTTIDADIAMAPEPGSLFLLGTGLLILVFVCRRAMRPRQLLGV